MPFAFLLIVPTTRIRFLIAFVSFPYLLVVFFFFYSLSIAEPNVFFAEMVQ